MCCLPPPSEIPSLKGYPLSELEVDWTVQLCYFAFEIAGKGHAAAQRSMAVKKCEK
jgi:hypothetical protein